MGSRWSRERERKKTHAGYNKYCLVMLQFVKRTSHLYQFGISLWVIAAMQLDVDRQRDDDASPMSSYRCMSSSQVKIRTFWRNFSDFWVSMLKYSWRPFHWYINYQCRTDIDEAKMILAFQHKSKFELQIFIKKKFITNSWLYSSFVHLSLSFSLVCPFDYFSLCGT